MPWIFSSSLQTPLSSLEREELFDGKSVIRQEIDGVVVISPRSIVTSYGIVTGLGITYGLNGEDAFFHHDGRLVDRSKQE